MKHLLKQFDGVRNITKSQLGNIIHYSKHYGIEISDLCLQKDFPDDKYDSIYYFKHPDNRCAIGGTWPTDTDINWISFDEFFNRMTNNDLVKFEEAINTEESIKKSTTIEEVCDAIYHCSFFDHVDNITFTSDGKVFEIKKLKG